MVSETTSGTNSLHLLSNQYWNIFPGGKTVGPLGLPEFSTGVICVRNFACTSSPPIHPDGQPQRWFSSLHLNLSYVGKPNKGTQPVRLDVRHIGDHLDFRLGCHQYRLRFFAFPQFFQAVSIMFPCVVHDILHNFTSSSCHPSIRYYKVSSIAIFVKYTIN
jgi:hypothetical protein